MSTDVVTKWLSALGTLCAGSMTAEDARTKIGAYATMLDGRFQPWAYSRRSLEAVAVQSKFWPSYGELCERLDAWCRENKPASDAPRLAAPTDQSPSEYRAKLDVDDRKFWEDHLAALSARPHPDFRWVRAMEISAQLNQPDSDARPWIVPMLNQIIRQAEQEGADTSQAIRPAQPYPKKEEPLAVPRMRSVPRRPEDMAA
jgi:hypothetical protein